MVSSPITPWQTDEGKMKAMTNFTSLGSKITVDSDCSHEIKKLAHRTESYDKPRVY